MCRAGLTLAKQRNELDCRSIGRRQRQRILRGKQASLCERLRHQRRHRISGTCASSPRCNGQELGRPLRVMSRESEARMSSEQLAPGLPDSSCESLRKSPREWPVILNLAKGTARIGQDGMRIRADDAQGFRMRGSGCVLLGFPHMGSSFLSMHECQERTSIGTSTNVRTFSFCGFRLWGRPELPNLRFEVTDGHRPRGGDVHGWSREVCESNACDHRHDNRNTPLWVESIRKQRCLVGRSVFQWQKGMGRSASACRAMRRCAFLNTWGIRVLRTGDAKDQFGALNRAKSLSEASFPLLPR